MSTPATSTSTSAPPPPPPPAIPLFPDVTTYKGAFAHWWNASKKDAGALAEERVLKRGLGEIPLLREGEIVQSGDGNATGDGNDTIATLRTVVLDEADKDRYLNCLEIGNRDKKEGEVPIVLLHGYGGGLGFYFQSFQTFAAIPNTRWYLLDLPGMGRSGRSKFPSIPKGDPQDLEHGRERTRKAEQWFVDALETFRTKMGLNRFILAGHSLGGYFSVSYTLQHPSRVSKLLLISPAGVPESRTPASASQIDQSDEEAATQAFEHEFQAEQIDATMNAGASVSARTSFAQR